MTKAELKTLRWLPVCLNDVRRRIADLQQLRCSTGSSLYAPRRALLGLYQTEADRLQGSLQAAEQTAERLYFSVNTVNRMQRKAYALLGM